MNAAIPGVLFDPQYGNGAQDAATVRGVISRYAWSASFADITDGLSNTFFAGEVIHAWCAWEDWGHQSFVTTAHPINYRNQDFMAGTIGSGDHDSCIGFRSRHPGGAQFLMGDGSARFLSETIDFNTYCFLASRAGNEVAGAL